MTAADVTFLEWLRSVQASIAAEQVEPLERRIAVLEAQIAAHKAPLLSIPQVAEELGLSAPSVARLADAGEIPTIKLPGSGSKRFRRIRREDLEAFIEARRIGSGAGK